MQSGFSDANKMENEKLLIDLTSIEHSVTKNGSQISKDMFYSLFGFIYTNKLEVDVDGEYLFHLIELGQFMDMPQLKNYIVEKISPINRLFLKYKQEEDISSEDWLKMAFDFVEIEVGEFEPYPMEFMHFVISQPYLPMTCKLSFTNYQLGLCSIEIDRQTISDPVFEPFKSLFETLRQEIEVSNISLEMIHETCHGLAQFIYETIPQSAPIKPEDKLVIYDKHIYDSESGGEETFTLFGALSVVVKCDERSSCHWWDLILSNNFGFPVSVTWLTRSRYALNTYNRRPTEEIFKQTLENSDPVLLGTIYGDQLVIGYMSVMSVILIERID